MKTIAISKRIMDRKVQEKRNCCCCVPGPIADTWVSARALTFVAIFLTAGFLPVSADDTIVKFIGKDITYDYWYVALKWGAARAPSYNANDTARWNFSIARADSLWGNGASRNIYGGLLVNGEYRGVAMTTYDDHLYAYGDARGAATSVLRLHLLWIKDDFLNSYSGKTVGFTSASTIYANCKELTAVDSRAIRFVIKDGSTYYLSEYAYTTTGAATNVKISLSDFNNNSASNKRWGVFTPSSTDFGIPGSLPTFSARNFTDVQAVGLIIEQTHVANTHFIKFDTLIVTALQSPLTLVVKTDTTGTSNSDQFTLPLKSGSTYNFTIDWGDGLSLIHI